MAASPSSLPESSRKESSDWRLFLTLLPYARRNSRVLIFALCLLFPLAIASAVQPILVGQVISILRQEPTRFEFLKALSLQEGLNVVAWMLFATVAVRLCLQGLQGYLVQKVGQRITADIRQDLFHHVVSLAMGFFDRTPVGRLITRLTSDVDALGEVFSTGAVGIVSDIFSIGLLIAIMFYRQWQLALLLILLLLPVTGLIIFFQYQFRKANYRAREKLSDLNSALQENLVGVNIVQLFGRESLNAKQFRKTNYKYVQAVDETIFYDSAVSAVLEWISLVAIAGVLWFGGVMILNDALTFGILAEFILFAQRLFNPLREFAEKFTAIQAGFTAIERISGILGEPIAIQDPGGDRYEKALENAEPTKRGEIRFENVSLAYKDDELVLRDLNFTIPPGQKVAFVGPTGAGKSSIIRLLCRLYEVSSGRILIDGVDIRDMPQSELRRHLGVILQDGFIFAGDVNSNISLGETYTQEEIQSAAERTNVDQFIKLMGNGYNTELRERGSNLSAGQK
ncbi:MAG: ABC transporter ATP-binding protein, partial [Cyanobacteria bacterium P01_F01_bin.153]